MKKLILLCVVTTVVTSVTGCGCCRRFRDFLCRGAYCGSGNVVAAPAPIAAPIVAAPMAYDPGCSYAGYDPGCGYQVGYGGAPYDSGWVQGAPVGDGGSYTIPSGGGFLVDPNAPATPGPAPLGTN